MHCTDGQHTRYRREKAPGPSFCNSVRKDTPLEEPDKRDKHKTNLCAYFLRGPSVRQGSSLAEEMEQGGSRAVGSKFIVLLNIARKTEAGGPGGLGT